MSGKPAFSKDPRKRLEAVGDEAMAEMAELTEQATAVLREGLSPEARDTIPYRDRQQAAKYVLDYALPQSPSRQATDGMTLQLLNQDGQSMALFIQKAGELERIPHELADVAPVDDDPHLIPAGTPKPEDTKR